MTEFTCETMIEEVTLSRLSLPRAELRFQDHPQVSLQTISRHGSRRIDHSPAVEGTLILTAPGIQPGQRVRITVEIEDAQPIEVANAA